MAVQISTCYDGATAANQQESRRPGQEPGAWWLQGIILFVIFLPLSFQFSANPPVQRSFRCVRRRTFLGSNLTYYYSFALCPSRKLRVYSLLRCSAKEERVSKEEERASWYVFLNPCSRFLSTRSSTDHCRICAELRITQKEATAPRRNF